MLNTLPTKPPINVYEIKRHQNHYRVYGDNFQFKNKKRIDKSIPTYPYSHRFYYTLYPFYLYKHNIYINYCLDFYN